MGAGASAETARTTVTTMLSGKPADASDITVKSIWEKNTPIPIGKSNRIFLLCCRILSKQELKSAIYEELQEIFRINLEVSVHYEQFI